MRVTASFAPRPILPKKHNHPKIDRTRSRLHPEQAQTAGYVQGEKGGSHHPSTEAQPTLDSDAPSQKPRREGGSAVPGARLRRTARGIGRLVPRGASSSARAVGDDWAAPTFRWQAVRSRARRPRAPCRGLAARLDGQPSAARWSSRVIRIEEAHEWVVQCALSSTPAPEVEGVSSG